MPLKRKALEGLKAETEDKKQKKLDFEKPVEKPTSESEDEEEVPDEDPVEEEVEFYRVKKGSFTRTFNGQVHIFYYCNMYPAHMAK